MKIYQNILVRIFIILLLTAFMACENSSNSDGSSNTPLNDSYYFGALVINSESELPACNDTTDGKLYYISEEKNFAFCNSTEYEKIAFINIYMHSSDTIQWLGIHDGEPTPCNTTKTNFAYYNSTLGQSLICDGVIWHILAEDGTDGADAVEMQWQGSHETAPVTCDTSTTNFAYHNSTEHTSYICDGTNWLTITQDGTVNPTVIYTTPQNNTSLFDLSAYIQ